MTSLCPCEREEAETRLIAHATDVASREPRQMRDMNPDLFITNNLVYEADTLDHVTTDVDTNLTIYQTLKGGSSNLTKIMGATCIGLSSYYFREYYRDADVKALLFLLIATAFFITTFFLVLSSLISVSTATKTIFVKLKGEIGVGGGRVVGGRRRRKELDNSKVGTLGDVGVEWGRPGVRFANFHGGSTDPLKPPNPTESAPAARKGHYASDCHAPKKPRENGQQNTHSDRSQQGHFSAFSAEKQDVMLMSTVTTEDNWTMDSGASAHVTNLRDYFSKFEETVDNTSVVLGNN
uniref:Retrovirus-related Pol polyprotein from transposon TNT 1-94-like beta-barrel domain-containing protein n=1 Tax=Timema tahoe TaxID=61484 RepID=A0A7R9NWE9_9NEOP|nr:unnamed protein product [Timema tahoe]